MKVHSDLLVSPVGRISGQSVDETLFFCHPMPLFEIIDFSYVYLWVTSAAPTLTYGSILCVLHIVQILKNCSYSTSWHYKKVTLPQFGKTLRLIWWHEKWKPGWSLQVSRFSLLFFDGFCVLQMMPHMYRLSSTFNEAEQLTQAPCISSLLIWYCFDSEKC